MPSLAHEITTARLRDKPTLLSALARALGLRRRRVVLRSAADSAVRLANPAELRPDVLLTNGSQRGPWDAIEVQRRVARDKEKSWPLLVSLLHARRGVMGDLWVLTNSANVARWARRGFKIQGPGGTTQRIVPRVILLSVRNALRLLRTQNPALAFFAAFAMHRRRGRRALQILWKALEISANLSTPLREKQIGDILAMLDPKLSRTLKGRLMTTRKKILPPAWFRQWNRKVKAEGVAQGQRSALIDICHARGFRIPKADKERIEACSSTVTLGRWILRAIKAETLSDVFATSRSAAQKKPAAKRGAAEARAKRERPSPRIPREKPRTPKQK